MEDKNEEESQEKKSTVEGKTDMAGKTQEEDGNNDESREKKQSV